MELSELTPELFETAEFTERRRGYDIDQVERFLEETGTALAQLLALYRRLEERATRAEARAQELEKQLRAQAAAPKAEVDEDDEIERATSTLVMARKTADATVAEAKGRAQTLVSDAEAKSEALVVEARQKAEAEYATAKGRAIQEVARLEGRRDDLRSAVSEIESKVDGYRAQLRGVAASLDTLVDDPTALGITGAGEELGEVASDADEAPAAEVPEADLSAGDAEDTPIPSNTGNNWTAGDAFASSPDRSSSPGQSSPDESGPDQSSPDESANIDQPTQAVDEVEPSPQDAPGPGSDKYLRELEGLDSAGDDQAAEEAMSAFFDSEDEPGRRFGWRR